MQVAMQPASSDAAVTDIFPRPMNSINLLTVADCGKSSNRLFFLQQFK